MALIGEERVGTLQWCQERGQWVDEWDHIVFRFCLWRNDGACAYVDVVVKICKFAICLNRPCRA
jgi:hypothetical protein